MAHLDEELLRHALQVARQNGYAEVEIEEGDSSFKAKLGPAPRPQSSSAGDPALPSEPELCAIKSNAVGYLQETKPTLSPGQRVNKGDVVAAISALGLTNDVESTVSGEIVEVLVQSGDAVEYGQVLAKVRP